MNSQKYNKEELYPEDFTEEDKEQFEILFQQAKILFPKLANDDWIIKKGIFAYMRKQKRGEDTVVSPEEIAEIKNQYTKDTIFYTEPIEAVEVQE